jgi:hypothetical protein
MTGRLTTICAEVFTIDVDEPAPGHTVTLFQRPFLQYYYSTHRDLIEALIRTKQPLGIGRPFLICQAPCVSIVVASNKNGEETAHHANKIFTCLPYHDDPEDD